MKIKNIKINSYKTLNNIDINLNSFNEKSCESPLNTVVLIGKNGTGKTSLLEFIFNFFNMLTSNLMENTVESDTTYKYVKENGMLEFDIKEEKKYENFLISDWITKNKFTQIEQQNLPRIVYIPVEMNYPMLENKQQNYVPEPKFLQKIDTQIIENIPSYITTKIMREALLQSNITTDKVRENIFNEFNELFTEMNLDIKLKEIDSKTLLPVFMKNNDKFDINNLSSGEKQIFLRILSLKMLDINNSIILIDEPETSLHPTWQQKIIKLYEKIGKNNQLIVATQSPFIVSGVKSENIIIFQREKNKIKIKCGEELEENYGQPVERVLKDMMETEYMRTPEIEKKLLKLRKLVDENKFDTKEYSDLRDELGEILHFDSDLMMIDLDVKKRMRDINAKNK